MSLAQPPLYKNAGARSSRKNGNALRRGKACVHCRHLKIVSEGADSNFQRSQSKSFAVQKCDGIKPICGPCSESTKDANCQYTDLPSRASRLQSDIEELVARIEVLETSNGSSRKNVPAQSSSLNSRSLSLSLSLDSRQSPNSSTPTLRSLLFGILSNWSLIGNLTQSAFSLDVDYSLDSEPPVHERASLIDKFISRCATLAFFLNLEMFRSSALLPLPLGDPRRPSPALLACVYLWGLRISSSPWKSTKGTVFLRRARQFIALEGVGTRNRTQVMHLIQAKILLIIYLVHWGQFLEAEFHGNGAISLVLSYGLHKIIPTSDGVYDDPEGRLSPCTGPVDQAERINAFCNSFGSLDSYLEIQTPLPSNTQNCGPDRIGYELYWRGPIPEQPVYHVLGAIMIIYVLVLGIYSKSAILLHRALYLHKQIDTGDSHKIAEECTRLEQIVLNFYSSLPEISYIKELEARSSPFPPFICSEKLSLMRAAVGCAWVNIQSIFSSFGVVHEARKRLVDASRNVYASLELTYPGSHPLAGTLSRLTCEAIVRELNAIKAESSSASSWTGDVSDMGRRVEEESQLVSTIIDGMGTMSILVICCPLVELNTEGTRGLDLVDIGWWLVEEEISVSTECEQCSWF
ncbi:hypothetical protein F5876DRAFT_67887 [Lentinula aff. lateritia]|uniref:Uncharacterized protein n=1 Tax=Lentinula aff. lateritia TaxID=2804960 RepID=A0ACC1TSW5_9AGAR|nr:hypothetical protein F5876DRAFT_67887 [Lentinula aff. lateritia]